MASSYTVLGTEKMTTGENAGTWGTKTNTNLVILEQAFGGYLAKSIAGSAQTTTLAITDGDSTASTSEARHQVIKLTGAITGNQVVTVPNDIVKTYIVSNATTGDFTVTFQTVSGSGFAFAGTNKGVQLLFADGTNVVDTGISSVGSNDLDGDELILDADADTSITADSDDQIDIKIAGADDFQFTANTFTAQSGSTIAAQALTATTVTASGIVKTDDTTAATSTTDGSLQTDGGLSVAADAIIGDDLKLLSDSAVLSFGADSDTTLTHTDGTGLTLNSANKLLFRDSALSISSSTDGQLDIDADTEVEIATTTLDLNGALDVSGASQFSSTITVGENDTGYDVKFFGDTASAYMLWDTSADDLVLAGAAGIDLAGDIDVDGTANLDVVDIDGAVQIDNTITVGENDTGYDVKFFGATSGAYMLWDESTDDLVLAGASKLYLYDAAGGEYLSSSGSALTIASGGVAWELPAADGSADQLLKTDGSGNLDWTTVSGTITALNNQSANRLTTIGSTTTELDGEANLTFTGSALTCIGTVTTGVDGTGHDVKFFSATSGSYWLWDESADGVVQIGSLTVGVNDAGHDVKFFGDTASAYMLWDTSADDLVLAGDAGIDLAGDIDVDGTANLDAVDIDGNTQVDGTITVGANDQGYDVKLFGDTASAYMLWDTSADDLVLAGDAGIDLAGDIDVDGTANLDTVDIDGNTQADGTITVGANDTGYDVKLFGATASSYMLWDESADSLLLNAATLDLNGTADGLILDADGDTTISSPSDDQIDFEIAGADDFTITANTFTILAGSTIVNSGTMSPDISSTGKALVLGF